MVLIPMVKNDKKCEKCMIFSFILFDKLTSDDCLLAKHYCIRLYYSYHTLLLPSSNTAGDVFMHFLLLYNL